MNPNRVALTDVYEVHREPHVARHWSANARNGRIRIRYEVFLGDPALTRRTKADLTPVGFRADDRHRSVRTQARDGTGVGVRLDTYVHTIGNSPYDAIGLLCSGQRRK